MERKEDICRKCALYGSPCVFATRKFLETPYHPIILFVGEAPGQVEVANEEVFSGESGSFLIQLLKENGLLEHSLLTNAIRCLPPSPRTMHWWDNTGILCDYYLHWEIKEINPDLVVALGEAALHYISGRKKKRIALGKKGEVLVPNFRPVEVFVTYNPAHIFHRADSRVEETFKEHLRRIAEYVRGRAQDSEVFERVSEYLVFGNYDRELESFLALVEAEQRKDKTLRVALDIEVGAPHNTRFNDVGKDPLSEILLVGIGTERLYRGFVFYDTDKQQLIGDISKWEGLRRLLTEGKFRIYMHNASFEIAWFLRRLGVYPVRFVDTMMLAHLLNENMISYSLESLCRAYGVEVPLWKGWVGDEGNYARIPLNTLGAYNYYDVITTFKLGEILVEKLMKSDWGAARGKVLYFVKEIMPKIAIVVGHMTASGIPSSTEKQKEVMEEIESYSERILCELRGHAPTVENFLSTPQVYTYLKSIGVDEVDNFKTEKGNPSLTKNVIEQLIELRPDVEFLKLLLEYRESIKLLSTYVSSLPDYIHPVTKRIYPNIHVTGTKTGRLSTSNPPLQNYPSERISLGKLVRKVFYVPEGYSFIACDAKQHELRVLAVLSKDENLIGSFLSGQDVHARNASLVLKKPIEEITPEERQLGKKLSFAVVYGVTPEGAKDIFRLGSVDEAKALLESIREAFPKAMEYIEKGKRSVLNYPYFVVSFLGRVRRPLAEIVIRRGKLRENSPSIQRAMRQAGNFLIQSVASDLWCLVAYHVFEKFHELGLDRGARPHANICILIHDSLYIVCKKELIDAVLEILKGAIAYVSKVYLQSEELPITAEYAVYPQSLGDEPEQSGEFSIEEIKKAIREELWSKKYDLNLEVDDTLLGTPEENPKDISPLPIQKSLFDD